MDAREKLNEFAELRGWNKNKLIGWSEAADFGEWFLENYLEEKLMCSKNIESCAFYSNGECTSTDYCKEQKSINTINQKQ